MLEVVEWQIPEKVEASTFLPVVKWENFLKDFRQSAAVRPWLHTCTSVDTVSNVTTRRQDYIV